MKEMKIGNQIKFIITLCVLCITTFLFGIEAKAATSGTIPCSEGSVTWTLDENGVLTFSGNGTTDIKGKMSGNQAYGNWVNYWEDAELDRQAVYAVKVAQNSRISFDTCKYLFREFRKCKSIDLSGFDTKNATSMRCMFDSCNALTNLDVIKLKTTNTTNMAYMFYGCKTLTQLDLSGFDTKNVTNMQSMFCKCESLTQLDVSGFDTKNVTDMTYMFYGCKSLTQLDVSGFDIRNVTNMRDMFYNCESLTQLDLSGFDTKNVTNMAYMFYGCKTLTQLDVSGFDTKNVTNMQSMFSNCESLTQLDVSGFDTKNVTNMQSMFYGCKSLTQLDVSGFDTRNVTNMQSMFYNCESLTQLNVSGLNTKNVTNMTWMFYGCKSLKQLDVSGFDTRNVTNMAIMFYGCESLTQLDVSGFDTRNVTDISWMFHSCRSLTQLDLHNFNTTKVTTLKHMFMGCHSLTKIDLSSFDTRNVTNTEGMFFNCKALEVFITPKTQLTVALPTIPANTCWVDANKNIYSSQKNYTFYQTKVQRVNETYKINYVTEGQLVNCPTTYKVTEGLSKLGTVSHLSKKFVGWYLDTAYTIPITTIEKGTFGDLTLYAKLEKNADPTEDAILNNGDNDIKGSSFSLIQARADKTTKNSIRLKWNRVTGADGYMVYGNKCNPKNKYEPIETITSGDTTTFIHKNRKKGTYYKYTIYAYKIVNGKREKVAVSKTVHATTKGSKNGNAKSVKVNKTKVSLKKGKTFKLKCSEVAEKGKKVRIHRAIAYESSNTKIATVTKKGVIKAKKKGTCYVYAYAQDGVYKKIKVTVK